MWNNVYFGEKGVEWTPIKLNSFPMVGYATGVVNYENDVSKSV